MEDAVDGCEPLGLLVERGGFREAREQPAAVVQRRFEAVERRATSDGDGAVALDAQLLPDALEERFRKRVDAQAPFSGRPVLYLAQNRGGVRQRTPRIARPDVAQPLQRALFHDRFLQQTAAHVRVVVRAVERLLEAPVAQVARRRRALHVLELLERGVDGRVRRERAAPVALQREQPLCERIGIAFTDEVAAVLPQDLHDVGLRVPAQPAPHELVDIVVRALRVGDEVRRVRHQRAEDDGFGLGPRVDLLALRRQRVGDVPVLHRVLAAQAVRDVRIPADAVPLRHVRAQHGQAVAHLRPEDDPGQPRGLGLEDAVELVHPRLREALRRHPHLRRRVVLVKARRLPLEQRHQVLGLRVAGIAARDEDRVQAGSFDNTSAHSLTAESTCWGLP